MPHLLADREAILLGQPKGNESPIVDYGSAVDADRWESPGLIEREMDDMAFRLSSWKAELELHWRVLAARGVARAFDTTSAIAPMKSGRVLNDSVRLILMPRERAKACASTSRS